MPDFLWQAAQADSQIVEGRLQAVSQAQAMHQLRSQGLTPLKITALAAGAVANLTPSAASHAPSPSRLTGLFRSTAITQADMLVMTSELSIMLKAGLALDNALRVLIGMNAKPAMEELTQTILDDVKSGVPLSRALARHPQQFGDFYINMVRSGEASGQLSDVLERLVEHLERLRALRESVVSATIYPAILLVVAVLSVIGMLGFVVPQFETLFKGMGDALPTPTRIIMTIGHAFTDYGLFIGLGLVLLFWVLRQWLRSPAGRQWWQTRALRLPLIGPLMLKYDLTLFSRSLGTLLGNGVPLLSALRIATLTVGNINLRQALEGVIPQVKGGGRMVEALKSSGVFEPLAINLIKVGEETGRLGPMLLELARIFNRDVETGIKRGLTLLEPLLILVLGLLIAAIIVSIMLGILSVNDLAA
jgi:general secretion pathway protein F